MQVESVKNPELFFGLVGPIGVDLDSVVASLEEELRRVHYTPHVLRITELMRGINVGYQVDESDYASKYKSLIRYADDVCERCESNSALAALAVLKIQKIREQETGDVRRPAQGHAYIIRQFKRPAEIEALRRVYGRKFIQVSVYANRQQRTSALIKKIQTFDYRSRTIEECENAARELISIDYEEKDVPYGQKVSKVFHLGDVFVTGYGGQQISEHIRRFIDAFFGHNGISPTKGEYALYMATAASLRSIDLSRQVGAAIFTDHGDVVSLGCNEVPKAFGGTYWDDDDSPLHRDFEEGVDANQIRKFEILHDLLSRLEEKACLSQTFTSVGDTNAQIDKLMDDPHIEDALLLNILEFGRIMHAEASAISDAARLGRSTKGCILYCTTFPCHMCAKQIVAAGIKRVVFLEPYPKSYAEELHRDSITFDPQEASTHVLFEPFVGISPRRYRDIFEKRERKDKKGNAIEWYEGEPLPRVEDRTANYILNETPEMAVSFNRLAAELLPPTP